MFVKYTPAHPHVKVVPVVNGDGLSVAAESVILNPGTNEVSDEKWEKIKASLSAEIKDGSVKPFSVETKKSGKTSKAMTLKDVPAVIATKIISGCSNKDTLRGWFKESLPDELALLVVKRMRQLNMDIDEITGEGEALSDGDIIDEGKAAAEGKQKSGEDGEAGKTKAPETEQAGKGKSGTKGLKDEIPDFDNPSVKVK